MGEYLPVGKYAALLPGVGRWHSPGSARDRGLPDPSLVLMQRGRGFRESQHRKAFSPRDA